MGEHTIREILKRRSPETQRAMQRRRDLAGGGSRGGSAMGKLVVILVLLAVLGGAGFLAYRANQAAQRFVADKLGRGSNALTLANTTEFLPNTLLAVLDPNYYNTGAMGGAIVTRQVARQYFPDASAIEIRAMTVALEVKYSKTDILEAYVNGVPLGGAPGHPVKGFAAASQYYFSKPFAQLGPQDIALLVALATGPGLDPREHPDKALAARNGVLQSDLAENILSQEQVNTLIQTPLGVTPQAAP